MERPSLRNPTEVSVYWTPQHVDVTDAPLRYASPKADWVDGYWRLRSAVVTDAGDRMVRRRAHTRAVVDPTEITVLPPIVVRAPEPRKPVTAALLDDVRMLSARLRRWRVAH